MITAKFEGTNGRPAKVTVSGHAGYADAGQDIVCASVTSAVQLTANAITEVLDISADVVVLEDTITIAVPNGEQAKANDFLSALRLHLEILAETYPGTIEVTDLEV